MDRFVAVHGVLEEVVRPVLNQGVYTCGLKVDGEHIKNVKIHDDLYACLELGERVSMYCRLTQERKGQALDAKLICLKKQDGLLAKAKMHYFMPRVLILLALTVVPLVVAVVTFLFTMLIFGDLLSVSFSGETFAVVSGSITVCAVIYTSYSICKAQFHTLKYLKNLSMWVTATPIELEEIRIPNKVKTYKQIPT